MARAGVSALLVLVVASATTGLAALINDPAAVLAAVNMIGVVSFKGHTDVHTIEK